MHIFKRIVRIIINAPFFGIGIMSFYYLIEDFRNPKFYFSWSGIFFYTLPIFCGGAILYSILGIIKNQPIKTDHEEIFNKLSSWNVAIFFLGYLIFFLLSQILWKF
jgi:hypothetical protein